MKHPHIDILAQFHEESQSWSICCQTVPQNDDEQPGMIGSILEAQGTYEELLFEIGCLIHYDLFSKDRDSRNCEEITIFINGNEVKHITYQDWVDATPSSILKVLEEDLKDVLSSNEQNN